METLTERNGTRRRQEEAARKKGRKEGGNQDGTEADSPYRCIGGDR